MFPTIPVLCGAIYGAKAGVKLRRAPFDERQKCLLTEATEELKILPRKVYESAQSLESYRKAKQRNVWIRQWLALHESSHYASSKVECIRRLGCCASACGCCFRPRTIAADTSLDELPGGPLMRMVEEWRVGHDTHCSVDCGCCIRRRGFQAIGGNEHLGEEEGIALVRNAEAFITLRGAPFQYQDWKGAGAA